MAFAGTNVTNVPAKVVTPDAKAELQNVIDQIYAAKAAGQVPSAELYAPLCCPDAHPRQWPSIWIRPTTPAPRP